MIVVREHAGVFARISGNPTLISIDFVPYEETVVVGVDEEGKDVTEVRIVDNRRKAPLQVILAPSWTAKERAAFGIYIVEPFVAPDGKAATGLDRFERDGDVVRQVFDVVDAPGPSADAINAERDRRTASGFMFKGLLFQSRIEDQKRINGAGTLAAIAVMNGSHAGDFRWHNGTSDFVWISSDNRLIRMDAYDVIAFGQAAARWESEHVFAARALKDMVDPPRDYDDDKYWPQRA